MGTCLLCERPDPCDVDCPAPIMRRLRDEVRRLRDTDPGEEERLTYLRASDRVLDLLEDTGGCVNHKEVVRLLRRVLRNLDESIAKLVVSEITVFAELKDWGREVKIQALTADALRRLGL